MAYHYLLSSQASVFKFGKARSRTKWAKLLREWKFTNDCDHRHTKAFSCFTVGWCCLPQIGNPLKFPDISKNVPNFRPLTWAYSSWPASHCKPIWPISPSSLPNFRWHVNWTLCTVSFNWICFCLWSSHIVRGWSSLIKLLNGVIENFMFCFKSTMSSMQELVSCWRWCLEFLHF